MPLGGRKASPRRTHRPDGATMAEKPTQSSPTVGVEVLDALGRPVSGSLSRGPGAKARAKKAEESAEEPSEEGTGEVDVELNLPARPSASPSRSDDLLGYYLAEVRRYPLLDPEEERALAIRYQTEGDADAANRLVTANLRLVVKLAFQYHRQWSNVLDLIQEGNVGLVEALSRYDPYRGIRFSSYAQYWIRAMILRFLMDNYRIVRLGSTRHGRKLFFQLQKERDRLIREGVHPSTLALSRALDVPEHEVVIVEQHLAAPALSLNAPMGGPEGRPLAEVVSDDSAVSPEDDVARREMSEVFQTQLTAFAQELRDERELAIWHERLTAQEPASLSELGDRFGVSKERIRQVEARIKKRLKEHLTATLGDEIPIYLETPED
jgi:RNA polymerase sigma-32 factor